MKPKIKEVKVKVKEEEVVLPEGMKASD